MSRTPIAANGGGQSAALQAERGSPLIESALWPIIALTTCSGTPSSASNPAKSCRRAWKSMSDFAHEEHCDPSEA